MTKEEKIKKVVLVAIILLAMLLIVIAIPLFRSGKATEKENVSIAENITEENEVEPENIVEEEKTIEEKDVKVNTKEKEIDTSNLNMGYVVSKSGKRVEFYVPEHFEEKQTGKTTSTGKVYVDSNRTAVISLYSKATIDSIKRSFRESEYSMIEEKYILNGTTYTKFYGEAEGKEVFGYYIYEVDEDTYFTLYDSTKYLTEEETDIFLTIDVKDASEEIETRETQNEEYVLEENYTISQDEETIAEVKKSIVDLWVEKNPSYDEPVRRYIEVTNNRVIVWDINTNTLSKSKVFEGSLDFIDGAQIKEGKIISKSEDGSKLIIAYRDSAGMTLTIIDQPGFEYKHFQKDSSFDNTFSFSTEYKIVGMKSREDLNNSIPEGYILRTKDLREYETEATFVVHSNCRVVREPIFDNSLEMETDDYTLEYYIFGGTTGIQDYMNQIRMNNDHTDETVVWSEDGKTAVSKYGLRGNRDNIGYCRFEIIGYYDYKGESRPIIMHTILSKKRDRMTIDEISMQAINILGIEFGY